MDFKLSKMAAAAGAALGISFANKQDATQALADNGTAVGLYQQKAYEEFIDYLSKVQDLDEVLLQAGVPRHKLNVLLYDDEIAQAVETRFDALASLNLTLEPTEDENSIFIANEIGKFKTEIIHGAFQARLYGYSVMEVVYRKEGSRIGLQYVGEKPMQWFSPMKDGTLRYYKQGASSTGELCDTNLKFLLTRNKASWEHPMGEPLLSRLYWPWFFRQNGWQFWAKFLERFGSPLLVGKSSDSVKMVRALVMAHSQAAIGIDRLDTIEAVGSPNNNGAAFTDFENASLRRIQKVILGQTLTSGTDGGSGNRALGQVHNSIRADKLESDIKLIMPTIQRLVDALCLLNGFPMVIAKYTSEAGLEDSRAERDNKLKNLGVKFTKQYVKDAYSLDDLDFDIAEPAAPAEANPATPTNESQVKASMTQNNVLTFANRNVKFTKNQQDIEDIADDALLQSGLPLDQKLVMSAVMAATDLENLEQRLAILFESDETTTRDEFISIVEMAMRQAETLGYIHSEKG